MFFEEGTQFFAFMPRCVVTDHNHVLAWMRGQQLLEQVLECGGVDLVDGMGDDLAGVRIDDPENKQALAASP